LHLIQRVCESFDLAELDASQIKDLGRSKSAKVE
jgi:hypothetical protein